MEQIFKTFLQEQGVYEIFTLSVLKYSRCSLQHYCREHRISGYCLELNRSPLLTGSQAITLNKLWKQRWCDEKKKVLYSFLVKEGCLFQFIEVLPKGVTIETLCSNTYNINNAFIPASMKHLANSTVSWNNMNKKWRKHLREKTFHFN